LPAQPQAGRQGQENGYADINFSDRKKTNSVHDYL